MAYDDERTIARPALQGGVHVEQDGRRVYRHAHSVGFQYTNQTPYARGGLLSSPPTAPIHTAGPSRRPLPTPRNRPESMPPALRQAPLVVQAPAPSRPAILAPSATLAASPTAAPARRPLPTPVLPPARPPTKHASIDLSAGPASPVRPTIAPINTSSDRDLPIPGSLSRRTAPPPDPAHPPPPAPAVPFSTPPPSWPRPSISDAHETQAPRISPPWNRNLPSASTAPVGANAMERRSTVSGRLPPTVPSSRPGRPARAESPDRAQSARQTHSSPSRRPLPSSPATPPRVASLHQRIPASSEDEHGTSSPPDTASLSGEEEYEPMIFADPMQAEDDENDKMFVRNAQPSSPQYGIRDLPARSRMAIANRDDSQSTSTVVPPAQQEQATRTRTARSATLPQPPTLNPSTPQGQRQPVGLQQSPPARMSPPVSASFIPLADYPPAPRASTAEPQSLTLRLASMSLAEERERARENQIRQEASGVTPAQCPTGSVNPVRQQQGWHANVSPLPRAPRNAVQSLFGTTEAPTQSLSFKSDGTSSSPASLPASPTHPVRPFPSSPNLKAAFDRKSFAQQPPRHQSLLQSQLSERQLQKQRARDADINLDDAPPPSLRRSPSPIHHGFARAPAIEITNDTPPRRQWTPGSDVTFRTGNAVENGEKNTPAGFHAGPHSPETNGQSLAQPPSQRTAVPQISLPDGHHHKNSDADGDAFGPSVVVSGPGGDPTVSVSAPLISDTPSITISDHRTPVTSVSAADSSSSTFSHPKRVSDPTQSQRPGPSSGSFGSRHTQIQESSPSHSTPLRGPGCKRGLPPPPSSLGSSRTNGLSCGGCNGPIVGRIVSAMGQRWHPNCFRCTVCNELLEHVSSYERDGRPYCHLDYHETFAPRCFHCKTAIIDERFITLDDPALGKRTYHEQHFFCAECGDPFLAPSGPLAPSVTRTGELNLAGDGEFVDDDVGFTVYRGHPYCEVCHVRLRMPKCKACKKSIRDGTRAVEALGSKWCWDCFVCEGCKKPFEDPAFFLRNEKPFCEPCFSLMLRNEV